MALYALVRFKFNSQIDAVPVQDVLAVIKENGVRKFQPYTPSSVTDFRVSTRHKYAVLLTDSYGNLRRWYAMIGRLGASSEAVLNQAESVQWPDPINKKSTESSEPICHSQQMEMTTEKANASYAATPSEGLETQSKPASPGIYKPEMMSKLQEHEHDEQVYLKSHDMNQTEIDLINLIMNRLEEFSCKIVQRLDAVEQCVLDMPDHIKRICMTNVCDWLNSIPENLPEILGASDVKPDQVKAMTKLKTAVEAAASEGEEEENYSDVNSENQELKMKADQRVENDHSESEMPSSDSESPEKESFYSFLSGVISEN